jgi:hypothetical protein
LRKSVAHLSDRCDCFITDIIVFSCATNFLVLYVVVDGPTTYRGVAAESSAGIGSQFVVRRLLAVEIAP